MPISTQLQVPHLGVIEGFFGPPWSWEQRKVVIQTLAVHGFGHYVYAPKSDGLLRRDLSKPFTQQWIDEVTGFAGFCKGAKVNFGVGITPFGMNGTLSNKSLDVWRVKIKTLVELGVQTIAILFDDMHAEFNDLALNQIRIVDAALLEMKSQRVIVCPSYYSNDIVLDRVFGARPPNYLSTLGKLLDPAVDVYWTGEEVCSKQFGISDLARVAEQLNRKPWLWDNYPVNDGPRMSSHLHLRAFTGRPAEISDYIAGHSINPALQPHLSLIPAITLAMSYQQGRQYVYSDAFLEAARLVVGNDLALQLRDDLLSLQDSGLLKLGDRQAALLNCYSRFDHPAAAEVVGWLNGNYAVSLETVQTQ